MTLLDNHIFIYLWLLPVHVILPVSNVTDTSKKIKLLNIQPKNYNTVTQHKAVALKLKDTDLDSCVKDIGIIAKA